MNEHIVNSGDAVTSGSNPMSVNGEKWIVSTSDGRTITEDSPEVLDDLQRISPWSRLQELLGATHITQLRVQVLGRTHTCPSRSDRSKFPSSRKPTRYMCYRRMGIDALAPGSVEDHYIGMEVELDNGVKVITWIDIYTGDSWQQIE